VRRLLARIAPYVAHPPIRNRGTLCGSVAWGHPAAEWNAAALALEAELTLSSASGTRTVAAADWFLGRCRTAARPGEVIIEVRLPPAPDATITGFAEHRRTHASFAEVAAVAVLQLSGDIVESARVALAGVADVPLRAVEAEAALTGSPIADAPRRAAAALQRPALPDHHHAVAAELVRRAVAEAVAGR
jgi:carbon-monoxide dehydrogenase medium subunit